MVSRPEGAMSRHLVTLVVGLVAVAPMVAQAPDPYASKVRALAHPRYAEREKAARELEAAGEPALPALRAARTAADPEVRTRAAAVEAKIDRAVQSKRLLVAPRLALKFDRVPLDRAIVEFAGKTGLFPSHEAGAGRDRKRLVTLDTGEVPFWQAVHAFYEAAGLTEADAPAQPVTSELVARTGRMTMTVTGPASAPRVWLVDGRPSSPAVLDKALRVRVLPAAHARNRFDAERGEVTFHLDVDHAPALTLQEVLGVEVRRAMTADRQTLAAAYPPLPSADGPGLNYLAAGQQVVVWNGDMRIDGAAAGPYFPVTLRTGGDRPRTLAELEGVVVARVLAPPEPLMTVADVFGKGKDQSYTANGVTCRVTAAEAEAKNPFGVPRQAAAPGQPPDRQWPAPAADRPAAVQFQLTTAMDNEVLNFPVQVRGRQRQFIRINRGPRPAVAGGGMPDYQLKDADGKPVRVLSTWVLRSGFDGSSLTQDIQMAFEKPARGLDGLTLTVTGRRPVVVEQPFVLRDVPLP
jgi:hypothetical protein